MKYINAASPEYHLSKLNDPYSQPSVELWSCVFQDKWYKETHWLERKISAIENYEFYNGKILTKEARETFIAENKYPVETCEFKPYFNSAVSALMKAKPNGQVENVKFNDNPSAISAEQADLLLQKFKKDLRWDSLCAEVVKDGLISGFHNAVVFDLANLQNGGNGELKAKRFRYNSVFAGRSQNGDTKDIKDCTFVSILTYDEIVNTYPDRKKVIDKWAEQHYYTNDILTPIDNFAGIDSVCWAQARNLISMSGIAQNLNTWTIYRWIRPVLTKAYFFLDANTGNKFFIPPTWTDEQAQQWIMNHPYYEYKHEFSTVMWETTCTENGIILENAPSWYQKDGQPPFVLFTADVVDEVPRGMMDDLKPFVYANCIAETQGLAQVIKGSSSTTYIYEGAVEDEEYVRDELTKERGLVIMKTRDYPQEKERTMNPAYRDFSDRNRARAQSAVAVNQTMMGDIGQYASNKNTEASLAQGIDSQSHYLRSLVEFEIQASNIMLNAIPIVLTETEIINIQDEFGNGFQFPVNAMEQVQMEDGTVATRMINELGTGRYEFNIIAGSYSSVTRDEAIKRFIEFWKVGGSAIAASNPQMYIRMLETTPDRYFKEMGKSLRQMMDEQNQQAQQQTAAASAEVARANQAEQIFQATLEILKNSKSQIVANVSPKDIAENPEGFKAAIEYQQEAMEKALNTALQIVTSNNQGMQANTAQPALPE